MFRFVTRTLDHFLYPRSSVASFLFLGLFSFSVRAVLVLVLRSDLLPETTYEHGEIAQNILTGNGFRIHFLGSDGFTSQQAPVYPYLVAAFYLFGGMGTSKSLLGIQLFQCVLGSLSVLITVRLCWYLVADRQSSSEDVTSPSAKTIGWITGIGFSLYPTQVYAVTHIQVVILATFLLLWFLLLCFKTRINNGIGSSVGAGIVGGILVLTDPILVLIVVIGMGIIFYSKPTKQTALTVSCMVTVLLIITPWLIRNRLVHNEWVFVKSTFGYAFWQGNNSHSWGTDKIPKTEAMDMMQNRNTGLRSLNATMWEARHETRYIDDVLLKPATIHKLSTLSEPQKSRYLFRVALGELKNKPSRYLKLCLQRLYFFLLFDETNPKTYNNYYRLSQCVILIFSGAGLALSWKYRQGMWPTYAIFGCLTTFHCLTITSVRFHLPIEPIQLIWTAILIHQLIHKTGLLNEERLHRD
ncbi:MAG: hypothetical protein MK103_09930 [Planctomycetes bacterium]|nr:hypothetical protein [Planctomycetota bacterium]